MKTSFFKRFGKKQAQKGKKQYHDESKVRLIGFWPDETPKKYPDPGEFVDPDWDESERLAVLEFLAQGEMISAWRGHSWCRFSCKNDTNGYRDFSDGYYLWPEGLAHYIQEHQVKLPDEFIQHVKSQQGHDAERLDRIKSRRDPEYTDSQWWLNQTGNDLPSVITFKDSRAKRTPLTSEYPYSVRCEGPTLHKRESDRFQIVVMSPLGSLINSTYGIFLHQKLAEFLQHACPDLKLIPVTIFRKNTGEEWSDYLVTDPKSLTEASPEIFSDTRNHSGNRIWLYENSTVFVSKQLKDSIESAGFADLVFSHENLL